MSQASIPVDLLNPGQVFACLGFLEAADVLLCDAEGGFDWSDESDVRFVLKAAGERNPFEVVLDFLAETRICAVSPLGSNLVDRWGIATYVDKNSEFPVAPKAKQENKRVWIKESALPIVLRNGHRSLHVSHWVDAGSGRQPLKTWGGAAGKSGASRMNDLLGAVRAIIGTNFSGAIKDPFNQPADVSGFRLEMRRDYVPVDIGFSINFHQSSMSAQGFPIVEVLAAIGLENARPHVTNRLAYRYGAWAGDAPPSLARIMVGCGNVPLLIRCFSVKLGEPNDYDRSILFAVEDYS